MESSRKWTSRSKKMSDILNISGLNPNPDDEAHRASESKTNEARVSRQKRVETPTGWTPQSIWPDSQCWRFQIQSRHSQEGFDVQHQARKSSIRWEATWPRRPKLTWVVRSTNEQWRIYKRYKSYRYTFRCELSKFDGQYLSQESNATNNHAANTEDILGFTLDNKSFCDTIDRH